MLADTDLQQHIWHPCSQMKDYESFPPITITGAKGSYLHCKNGKQLIDAISSWWSKSLGHNHPRLKQALLKQVDQFEHVILANTTNDTIMNLSERLCSLMPGLNKVLYASDGSCAVEIALKMSVHARRITGITKRKKIISLSNGYHGETCGALSVSDIGIYRENYSELLFDPFFISPIPYVSGRQDPIWSDCSDHWPAIEKSLEKYADTATAIIVEPIIQGAGGMLIYSQDFLRRLTRWAKKNNIHVIADEIMSSFGRTGKMLACEHANITPDFICIGKGMTSGWLPMSCVITHDEMYQTFYDDYGNGKDFLHSHTFSGNALAASIAVEVFKIFDEENICQRAEHLHDLMRLNMLDIADRTGKLKNVRGIGAMVAADLVCDDPSRRLGYEVYQEAIKRGALLRPLGNTLYWLPPLIITDETLDELKAITLDSISKIC